MRPLEILLSAIVFVAASMLIVAPWKKSAFRIFFFAAVVALIVQTGLEGAHFQLIPLYLACLVLLLAFRVVGRKLIAAVGMAGILLVAATVLLSWMIPMFRLPHPTGPYAVGTKILYMIDHDRLETSGYSPSGKRELMVQTWYPVSSQSRASSRRANYQRFKELTVAASYRSVLKTDSYRDATIASGNPFPVLLYNPGWQGERTEDTFLLQELASHGYVIFAIDHTFYGGKVEFPDGRVEDSRDAPILGNFEHSTQQEQADLGAKFVHIEADDDVFVLNQVEAMNQNPGSPWYHKLDMSRVGAMGFSIGGAVAAQTAIQDQRVKAALNLDGWSFGDVQKLGLAKPWMVIYEDKRQTLPTSAQLNTGSPAEQAFWQFSQKDYEHVAGSMAANGGFLLFIADTQHVDFTDRSLFSPIESWTGRGTIGPDRAHQIIDAYTLAFFSHALNWSGNGITAESMDPLLSGSSSPFKEVEIQVYGSQ